MVDPEVFVLSIVGVSLPPTDDDGVSGVDDAIADDIGNERNFLIVFIVATFSLPIHRLASHKSSSSSSSLSPSFPFSSSSSSFLS